MDQLAGLPEEARRLALDRFRQIQPHFGVPISRRTPREAISSAAGRDPKDGFQGDKTAADAARLFKIHPATVSRLLARPSTTVLRKREYAK
jgi:hypothetical protein